MRLRFRLATLLVLAGAVLAIAGQPVEAQTAVNLMACKKLTLTRVFGGGFADNVTMRECGTRFTTQDPYIAVVIHLQRLRETVDLAFQLLDPSDNPVWVGRRQIRVEPDSGYENLWMFVVLPLAADLRALAAENPELALAALQLTGRPARERPGDWTLKLVARGTTHTLKFTIATVPGPAATPTPAAVPTPAPSPSP